MSCAFCHTPFNHPGTFCWPCLELLTLQRNLARQGKVCLSPLQLQAIAKPDGCRRCGQKTCVCDCPVCRKPHDECGCTARDLLEFYGVFGAEPMTPLLQPLDAASETG